MPKPDTAKGGDVCHDIVNDVKIYALLFHDVILLSCKMNYSLKVPSVTHLCCVQKIKSGLRSYECCGF